MEFSQFLLIFVWKFEILIVREIIRFFIYLTNISNSSIIILERNMMKLEILFYFFFLFFRPWRELQLFWSIKLNLSIFFKFFDNKKKCHSVPSLFFNFEFKSFFRFDLSWTFRKIFYFRYFFLKKNYVFERNN